MTDKASPSAVLESGPVSLQGEASETFRRVADAFMAHFTDHDELGASLVVFRGGKLEVDLWGGWKDAARTQPWNRDTRANVFSSTKAINATCYAMIVSRGLATYDDKVSKYWPEFAAAGKGDVTIGMLLSHQSGVTGFETAATLDDLYAEASAQRLAAQAPLWKPGTESGYNPLVSGIIWTALFSRIEGRSIKQFVAEEIAAPFGLDLSIGLPPELTDKAAEMIPIPPGYTPMFPFTNPAQIQSDSPKMMESESATARWRAADLPSANGFASAQGLAGLFELLLHPPAGDRALVSPEVLAQATRPWSERVDVVREVFTRWGAGFFLNVDNLYGPHSETFYHPGWGGSFVLCDPVADVSAAYVMNRMGGLYDRDPRRRDLCRAIFDSL
jgi:CubicO group peptidase (beta-lactamase class C family)